MRGVRHSFLAVVLLLVCGMASASARVVTATARHTSSVAVPNSSSNPLQPLEESHLPPNPRNGLFVSNNPINLVDPLGLLDWSPFQPGQWEYNDSRMFPDAPNRFDLAAHGHPNGRGSIDVIGDGKGRTWTPEELYNEAKDDPAFKNSDSVRMYVCQAGRGGMDSFAKEFSELSGKPVQAGNGNLDAARYTNGKPHFSRPQDMPFNLFKPSTWRVGWGKY